MKYIIHFAAATTLGSFIAISAASAQNVVVPGDAMNRLQQQSPSEDRKMTVAPKTTGAAGLSMSAAEINKRRSLQNLLEQVESSRGAQTGTLTVEPLDGNKAKLQYDLAKIRQSYPRISDAPFGAELLRATPNAGAGSGIATTLADVEYKSEYLPNSVEQIVSIRTSDSVAANAFISGPKPVKLQVDNAKLSAWQISSDEGELPVGVVVNGDKRKLKVGEVARFGKIDVTILASSNRSGKPGYEGQPYVLRLLVMPVD